MMLPKSDSNTLVKNNPKNNSKIKTIINKFSGIVEGINNTVNISNIIQQPTNEMFFGFCNTSSDTNVDILEMTSNGEIENEI